MFVLVAPRGIWGAVEDIEHYGLRSAVARIFSRQARVATDFAEEVTSAETHATAAVERTGASEEIPLS